MIVPFPPGGIADITGRPLAIAMAKTLGQNVVVENKAGAGGAVGHALGRKGEARRLHDHDGALVDRRDPGSGQGERPAGDLPDVRLPADRADLGRPDDPAGARQRPLEDAQGADRRRAVAARQDQLCLVGRLRDDPHLLRDARAGREREVTPRAVQGRRTGDGRAPRRRDEPRRAVARRGQRARQGAARSACSARGPAAARPRCPTCRP